MKTTVGVTIVALGVGKGIGAGIEIIGIEGRHLFQDQVGVIGGQGKQTDTVQTAAGRHDTRGADNPAGGFYAYDIVKRRRHPTGPRGIRAQGKRDQTQGGGHRRTGAGTAGDKSRVERVAANTVR